MALLFDYLTLTLLPWPLFAFDLPAELPTWSHTTPWLGLIVLLVGLGVTARLGSRRSAWALGPAWWLLGAMVVVQLVAPIGTYREVRLVYSLLPGLAIVVGALVLRLHVGTATRRRLVAAVLAIAAASMSLAVLRRNAEFRSESAWLEADQRRKPDHAPALLRLAADYRANGRLAEAEVLLRRVVELLPDSGQAWFELARCLDLRGELNAARAAYGRAVIANPAHGNAWVRFAALEMNAGRLDRAEQLIERAQALYPERIQVRYHRGLIDAHRGRLPAAIATLEQLLKDHPDLVRVAQILDHLKQHGRLPRREETAIR
jgi:tetratricopeptide (TPR) repeat protein